jgi:methanethiol oxidase
MVTWTPDPTFYPSPRLATQAPPEKLAYVASFDPTRRRPDAMAVVNLDPVSANYGQIVGQTDLAIGDELHHFGWNACSSCLCPNAHIPTLNVVILSFRASDLHVSTSWIRSPIRPIQS